jgi:hypothetical protein
MKRRGIKSIKPNWAIEHLPYEHLLNERVIGQPEACSVIAGIMAALVTRQKTKSQILLPRVLIAGPTSSGKSFLAEQVRQILNLPTAIINATTLTSPGYKGLNLSEAMRPLCEHESTRKGNFPSLIIIDEIDKLVSRSSADEWTKQIEYNLLPILNGDPVQIPDVDYDFTAKELRTTNALVIAMGVFNGVRPALWQKHKTSQIALRDFGFGDEFVSRFSHFIPFTPPNRKAIRQMVVRESEQASQLYAINKWRPELSPMQIDGITVEATRSPFGIRGVRGHIHQVLFRQAKQTATERLF